MNIIKNKEGIALITVLLLLVVVGTLTSALMISYTSNISRAGDSATRNRAFYAAEAGANYLNDHINKNAKAQNIVLQPIMEAELRNLTGDLNDEFFDAIDGYNKEDFDSDNPIFEYKLADDLSINNFNLSFNFDEDILDRENEIYGFIIEASNGDFSERIRLTYEIQTLPPFFRSSRQANKINIDNISGFGSSSNFPANSFATAEKYYDEWQNNKNYREGDIVYYNGNHYVANEDHESKNNWSNTNSSWDYLESGPDLRKFGSISNAIDYGMDVLPPQPPENNWSTNVNYLEGDRVSHSVDGEEKYYISYTDNPETEPGIDEGWMSDWSEYYNYKSEVVNIFDDLIDEYGGEVYSDENDYDYEVYDSSQQYNEGDILLKDGKIQKIVGKKGKSGKYRWEILDNGFVQGYESFLDDNLYQKGPFLKIDGDFNPEEYNSQNFSNMKTDESGVVHILIDGDININTNSNIDFFGNENIIMYVNGDLNFNPGFINIGGFNGQLAYFAPNATFTFKDQSNIGFGSSMVVNELNIINSYIREVSYDTENSPLIGKMNPKIAELSRSFATQHGGGTVSQINPVYQSWEQIE